VVDLRAAPDHEPREGPDDMTFPSLGARSALVITHQSVTFTIDPSGFSNAGTIEALNGAVLPDVLPDHHQHRAVGSRLARHAHHRQLPRL